MKYRILALALVLVMVAGLMSACGASSAESAAPAEASAAGSSAEAEAVPAAEEPAAEAPAEAAAPEQPASAEETEEAEEPEPIPEVEYPLTEEDVTFELWFPFPGDLSDIMEEYLGQGKNSVLAAAKEITGVNLGFILQSVNAATDNFNLMVASGDYPDLIFNPSSYYTGGMDKAVADEVLLDLTDMVPELAPNYYRLINQDETTLTACKTAEGRFVEIMRLEAEYAKPSTGLVIRQDWLDDLGLDTPVTLDDMHDVLTAFKNEKGAVEALGMTFTGILDGDEIASAFDAYGTYVPFMGAYPICLRDGKVAFGWKEDEMREYLELISQWYAEGLLGKDFYIENTGHGINYSKTTTDMVGVFLNDYFQLDLLEQFMQDPNARLVGIPAPVKEEGQTLHFGSSQSLTSGFSWAVTTDCSDPELAVQYADFYFTEEGSRMCNYGIEGEGMEYDADGNPMYTELVYNNPDHSMRETQVMYTLTVGPFVEVESRGDISYSENAIACRDIWGSNCDDLYTMPSVSLTADQSSEVADIMGDLMTYASGKITEFIIGIDSLDNWDEYISQLEGFRVDRVTEIYQEAYDASIA